MTSGQRVSKATEIERKGSSQNQQLLLLWREFEYRCGNAR